MIILRFQLALLTVAWTAADRLADGLRRIGDDEDGLNTTELAVLTFMLVGAAVVVTGILIAAAKSTAEAIPVPEAPLP